MVKFKIFSIDTILLSNAQFQFKFCSFPTISFIGFPSPQPGFNPGSFMAFCCHIFRSFYLGYFLSLSLSFVSMIFFDIHRPIVLKNLPQLLFIWHFILGIWLCIFAGIQLDTCVLLSASLQEAHRNVIQVHSMIGA